MMILSSFGNFRKKFNHFLYQFAFILKGYLTIDNKGKTNFDIVKEFLGINSREV